MKPVALKKEYVVVESHAVYTRSSWYSHIQKNISLHPLVTGKLTAHMTVILVDETRIKELDAYYQKRARVTDVLSFHYSEEQESEIFICIPTALRQAQDAHVTPEYEIARLFIHGVLHTIGFDHLRVADRKIMMPLNQALLEGCHAMRLC